jgi:DNA-binding MarR family transcriptional regulator
MDAMEVKASNLTLIIDGMVKKGWITRAKGSKDKRTNELKLTAEGEIIFKLIPDPVIKLNKDIQKIITKEEAITLEKALKKIIDEL